MRQLLTCDECGKIAEVPEGSAGKKVRCPGCGNVVTIPSKTVATIERWYQVNELNRFKVAGITHANPDGRNRQSIIQQLRNDNDWTVEIVRERGNRFDENAIAIFCAHGQIGYIPSDYSARWAEDVDSDHARLTAWVKNIDEYRPSNGRAILMVEIDVREWRFGPKPRKGTAEPPEKNRSIVQQ